MNLNNKVHTWTTQQVASWLKQEGFASYIPLFQKNEIDGFVLLSLTENDLKQQPLRMGKLGDIKKLFYKIQQLQRNSINVNTTPKQTTETPGSPSTNRAYSWSTQGGVFKILKPELQWYKWKSAEYEPMSSALTKVVLSALYLALSIFVTAFTMIVVHQRIPDPTTYPPLPDFLLDNIQLMPWAFMMTEVILLILGIIMFIVVFLHKYRLVILRRFCAITGTIFLVRCLTMFVTSMSVPSTHLKHDCMNEWSQQTTLEVRLKRAWQIMSGFGLSIAGVKTCGDYMFSGHTVMLTLLNYFIVEYTPYDWKGLHIITWMLNIFGAFFVLAAHEHYSIDVLIAFYLSSRLFLHYHTLANVNHLVHSQSSNGNGSSWFPMFSYLEEHTSGVVPNEYSWPWEWFIRSKRKKKQH